MKFRIMFGPPGAGKGTQAALLVEKYGFRHVSTGDLLRREISAGTEVGKKAAELINKGFLVPDSVVEEMISSEIASHPDVPGFLFDGFPRTLAQARDLDEMLKGFGHKVDDVISIIIDDATVKERIRHRAEVENRVDDTKDEIIENRIRTYHEKTEPLIAYYRDSGKYREIKGEGGIERVFEKICKIIEA